jgi:IS5 family transposase
MQWTLPRRREAGTGRSAKNRSNSKVRAKVEHVFGVMKGQFGFTKVRYKGLAKNAHHLFVSCALVNLIMAKKVFLRRRRLVLRGSVPEWWPLADE